MEGEDMRFDIKADAFVECSALRNQGIKTAIHTTLRVLQETKNEEESDCQSSNFCCCCIPSFIQNFVKIR